MLGLTPEQTDDAHDDEAQVVRYDGKVDDLCRDEYSPGVCVRE